MSEPESFHDGYHQKLTRKAVFDYVQAVAAGSILPRRPDAYEWQQVMDSGQLSKEVKDLLWTQFSYDEYGWGKPVSLVELEKAIDSQNSIKTLQEEIDDIECQIEDLEDEIRNLYCRRDEMEATMRIEKRKGVLEI